MHEQHVYHLDLKPDNFVIDLKGSVYLIDFGCARESSSGVIIGGVGDTRYYSLERLAHIRTCLEEKDQVLKPEESFDGGKADRWALGITLLEIALGKNPFAQCDLHTRLTAWDRNYFQHELSQIAELQNPPRGSYWEVVKALLEGKELNQVLQMVKGKEVAQEELKEVMPHLKALQPPPRTAPMPAVSYIPKEKNPHYASYGKNRDFYV